MSSQTSYCKYWFPNGCPDNGNCSRSSWERCYKCVSYESEVLSPHKTSGFALAVRRSPLGGVYVSGSPLSFGVCVSGSPLFVIRQADARKNLRMHLFRSENHRQAFADATRVMDNGAAKTNLFFSEGGG